MSDIRRRTFNILVGGDCAADVAVPQEGNHKGCPYAR